MQTMGEEGRLIVHIRSYKCKQWVMKKDSLFTERVTMQTVGNEKRKTHCSHKELQMQTMGNEERKTHCSHKELQCQHWVMK
ncbi:hypothetical protein KSS87_015817 [Heliosperma pusillum]|nr:hypothetical protein KSS87_015817 [Heliosperma pusillum]